MELWVGSRIPASCWALSCNLLEQNVCVDVSYAVRDCALGSSPATSFWGVNTCCNKMIWHPTHRTSLAQCLLDTVIGTDALRVTDVYTYFTSDTCTQLPVTYRLFVTVSAFKLQAYFGITGLYIFRRHCNWLSVYMFEFSDVAPQIGLDSVHGKKNTYWLKLFESTVAPQRADAESARVADSASNKAAAEATTIVHHSRSRERYQSACNDPRIEHMHPQLPHYNLVGALVARFVNRLAIRTRAISHCDFTEL